MDADLLMFCFMQLSLGEFLAGGLVRAACCRNAASARERTRQFIILHMSAAVAREGIGCVKLEWVNIKLFQRVLISFPYFYFHLAFFLCGWWFGCLFFFNLWGFFNLLIVC